MLCLCVAYALLMRQEEARQQARWSGQEDEHPPADGAGIKALDDRLSASANLKRILGFELKAAQLCTAIRNRISKAKEKRK
jgi:hypothetical protein